MIRLNEYSLNWYKRVAVSLERVEFVDWAD